MKNERSFFTEMNSSVDINKSISLVIPWRQTDSRIKAFNALTDWYKNNFPDFDIILCDSGSDLFNLSASRNIGLSEAFSNGSDIVILSDADVFVSKEALVESILNSINNQVITNPYTSVVELTEDETNKFFNFEKGFYTESSKFFYSPKMLEGKPTGMNPCSGNNVIPKSVWDTIGGFDENFVGWGAEDIAYLHKYLKEYGKIYDYTDGIAVSVFHEKEWDVNLDKNRSYYEENYLKKEI